MIQFDEFRLDSGRYELLRQGDRVKLEKLPMELLILLVEKKGQLVTRQEIIQHLWGADVFLDTEHGINTAVRKVRNALRDDPEQPRFVQTITGKGYRFIAPTTAIVSGPAGLPDGKAGENGGATDALRPPQNAGRPIVATPVSAAPGRLSLGLWSATALLLGGIGLVSALGLNVGSLRARLFSPAEERIHSLAVLPLENLSGDPAQDYFADGMTDELITQLAKISGLRVTSRTSAMQYKKTSRPLPQIARELGVDGILEGSVGRSGGRVHVTAQLIYAPADTHLWAESYDRDLAEAGALPGEMAQAIARQAGLKVVPAAPPPRRISPEAHDAYLLGRYAWFAGDYKKSKQYFEKAIALQPDYAAAWSGLADAYLVSGMVGEVRPADVMQPAFDAAAKGVALDDSLAEAHNTMGAAYLFYRWDWKRAERESARAIELNPGYAEGHHLRSYVLEVMNRGDEALREQRTAMELDPFARPWAMAFALIQAHQFDAALADARARSELQPDNASLHRILSYLYWNKGMEKEAAREWQTSLEVAGRKQEALAVRDAFQRGGMRAIYEWELIHFKKEAARHYVSPLGFANQYAYLHRRNEALDYLEEAYRQHEPRLILLQHNPNFDFLHSEPRYQAIVKNMGLPAAP